VLQVEQLVCGDHRSRCGRNARLRAQRVVQKAGGLVAAIAGEDSRFLRSAHAARELAGDIRGEVERGIAQQFLRDPDHAAHFVRAQRDLAESVVRFWDGRLLLHPGRCTLAGDQRDLTIAGGGGDHMNQRTHDVLFLKRLHQRVLKLIRDSVPAFAKFAYLQRVAHLIAAAVRIAHQLPERIVVGLTAATGLVGCLLRAGRQRRVNRCIHLPLQVGRALLALDGVAQIYDLLLHPLIGSGVLRG